MKKFDGIVIATDLDGTFFGSDGKTVDRNLSAVKYFTANGGHFTVSTGRMPTHVLVGFPDAENYVNIPAATCNGSYIYDFSEKKTHSIYPMSFDVIKELVQFIHSQYPMAGIRASSVEYGLLCTPESAANRHVKSDLERYSLASSMIADVDNWRSQSILKAVVRADADVIEEIFARMKREYGDTLALTQSEATFLEIQAAGRNKGVALKEIAASMGEGTRLYTCGDYLNDLEMLKAADVAVCPTNAHPQVKQTCDLCFRTNDDGLIADLIEYIDRQI